MGVGVANKGARPAYEDWGSEGLGEPAFKMPRLAFSQPGLGKAISGQPGSGFPQLDMGGAASAKGIKSGPLFSDLMNELDD